MRAYVVMAAALVGHAHAAEIKGTVKSISGAQIVASVPGKGEFEAAGAGGLKPGDCVMLTPAAGGTIAYKPCPVAPVAAKPDPKIEAQMREAYQRGTAKGKAQAEALEKPAAAPAMAPAAPAPAQASSTVDVDALFKAQTAAKCGDGFVGKVCREGVRIALCVQHPQAAGKSETCPARQAANGDPLDSR